MEFEIPEKSKQLGRRVRALLDRELQYGRISLSDWELREKQEFQKTLCQTLATHGLLVPHWPVEYGGQGGSWWDFIVMSEEMMRRGEPRGPQYMNVNYIGPALLQYGTEEQKDQFLRPMARGELRWCQGFSEPEAGSDLGAITTKVSRSGAGYVLSGRKVWTSYADQAEWCLVLATHSIDGASRGQMSLLMVDMRLPGIEVSKIDTIVGDHPLHEVRFDCVEVPAWGLLGDEGQAWSIVKDSLNYERLGVAYYAQAEAALEVLSSRTVEDSTGLTGRMSFLDAKAQCQAARLLTYQGLAAHEEGDKGISVIANTARAANVEAMRAAACLVDEFGDAESLMEGLILDRQFKDALVSGVGGGAYEILRGLIARHALDLPKAS